MISGSPGTGKTSIALLLKSLGHHVMHEVSRDIIQAQLKLESNVLPWQNLEAFSEIVFEERKVQFQQARDLTFYDRSLIDVVAYLIHDGVPVPQSYERDIRSHRYFDDVYITPPWIEIYEKDNERKESFEKALSLHETIVAVYQDYGYNTIEVPQNTVQKRTSFILNHLSIES